MQGLLFPYSVEPELSYQRPSGWLQMPPIPSGEEKFVGLFAVYNTQSNFIALQFEGDYTVDWGDGVIENLNSGVKAEHSYDYSAIDPGTLTERAYKQVIVTVIPQPLNNLTALDINVRNSNLPVTAGDDLSTAWLEIAVSMPYGLSMYVSSGDDHYPGSLEIARILDAGGCANLSSLFYYCTSLKEVVIDRMDSVEDISYMFESCGSLYSVVLPDCPSLLTCTEPFYSCPSLKKAFIGDVSNVGDFSNFFYNCYSLSSVTVKKVAGSGYDAFAYCYALKEVNLLDVSELTTTEEMFYECYSLQSFKLLQAPALTDTYYMFAYCYALREAAFESLPSLSSTHGMFYECFHLSKVSLPELPELSYSGSMFNYCYSLQYVDLPSLPLCTDLSYMFDSSGISQLNLTSVPSGALLSSSLYSCGNLIEAFIEGQPDSCEGAFSSCKSLRSLTFSDCSLVTSTSLAFDACPLLSSLRVPGLSVTVDLSNCLLSRDSLIQVFQDLGTVSGETFTVIGNWGEVDLTPSDIAIATGKGWNVITSLLPPPTLTITGNKNSLVIGETSTITFTFSSSPVDFASGDVITVGGSLTGLTVTGDPKVYEATFSPTAGVNNGTASVSVSAGSYTDLFGNPGAAGSLTGVTYDTLAPTISLTTPISSDGIINDSEDEFPLTISGTSTGADGRAVTVNVGGTYYTGTVANGGAWSVALTSMQVKSLTEGTVNVTANVTDSVGNEATQATASFTYDRTAPTIAITIPISGDGNVNNGEDNNTLTISGTSSGADNRVVTVNVGGVNYTNTVASGGAWSVTLTSAQIKELTEGTVNVTANVTDTAGNAATQASASFVYTKVSDEGDYFSNAAAQMYGWQELSYVPWWAG